MLRIALLAGLLLVAAPAQAFWGGDDCVMFCGSETNYEAPDFTPVWWGLGVLAIAILITGLVAAATGADQRGQQQQQVVVVERDRR